MTKNRYIFVADGGGSKTAAALFNASEADVTQARLLASARGEASGLALGVDNARKVNEHLLGYLLGMAGVDLNTGTLELVLGVAGSDIPNRAKELEIALSHQGDAHVISDAQMAMLGAHHGRPGISLTIGTGSVAWGISHDGKMAKSGGWGFPAGDIGSGAWIGFTAFSDFLRHKDGFAADITFSKHIEAYLEKQIGSSKGDWLAFNQEANAKDYAHFAKEIIQSGIADHNDLYCQNIRKKVVKEALELTNALQDNPTLPITMNGSVAMAIRNDISLTKPEWTIIDPIGDAIAGGLSYLDVLEPNPI